MRDNSLSIVVDTNDTRRHTLFMDNATQTAVRLTPAQISALECQSFDMACSMDNAAWAFTMMGFDGSRIAVNSVTAQPIADELMSYSNMLDYQAAEMAAGPRRAEIARESRVFSNLAAKVARAV